MPGTLPSHASSKLEVLALLRTMCDARYQEEDGLPTDGLDFETPFLTTNGINMGAGGAKGLLTLLCLEADLHATDIVGRDMDTVQITMEADQDFLYWRDTSGLYHTDVDKDKDMGTGMVYEYENQRFLDPCVMSTAGDDQFNMGSRLKLETTTRCHEENCMVQSDSKCFTSTLGAIYCERMILRTTRNRAVNDVIGDYDSHYMVDSIKLRLLSPVQKAQEGSNEPNPALGKGKALFEMQSTLPSDWKNVQDQLVPSRFLQRMRKHLPRTPSGDIDTIVLLPAALGGLTIAPEGEDLTEVLERLSEFHLYAIEYLISGQIDDRVKRVLSSFMRDRFARGVNFDENVIDELFADLEIELKPPPVGLQETIARAGLDLTSVDGYLAKRRKLVANGFVGDKDVKRLYSRAVLQKKLLLENVTAGWTQSGWPQRRLAYERSLERLFLLHVAEGRTVSDYKVDVIKLSSHLMMMSRRDLKSFSWEEEVFYHEDMTIFAFDDVEGERPAQPVKDLLESLMTMELPPIVDGRWFPKAYHPADQAVDN